MRPNDFLQWLESPDGTLQMDTAVGNRSIGCSYEIKKTDANICKQLQAVGGTVGGRSAGDSILVFGDRAGVFFVEPRHRPEMVSHPDTGVCHFQNTDAVVVGAVVTVRWWTGTIGCWFLIYVRDRDACLDFIPSDGMAQPPMIQFVLAFVVWPLKIPTFRCTK